MPHAIKLAKSWTITNFECYANGKTQESVNYNLFRLISQRHSANKGTDIFLFIKTNEIHIR